MEVILVFPIIKFGEKKITGDHNYTKEQNLCHEHKSPC